MRSRAIATLQQPFRVQTLGWRQPPLLRYRFQQSRLESQLITLRDGTQIRRQDVIFTRPKVFTFRRFATILAYGFGTYYTIKYVPKLAGFDIQVELDDDTQDGKEGSKEGSKRLQEGAELTEEDLDADEDSLFIPLTWAQALPREYYKGKDAEWQEFVKISNDTERQKGIWQLMTASFLIFAQQTNIVVHRLGADIKLAKHWLDMTFPDGPPIEYARNGIEIGDGFVAWSRQRIEAEKQHRITRALWPTALFSSAYASARMYTMIQWKQLTAYLGFETLNRNGTSFDEAFKQAAAEFGKNKLSKVHTDPDSSAATGGSSAAMGASETASKALWPLPAISVPSSGEADADAGSKLKQALAASAFAKTLLKNWQYKNKIPPRGTFYVHGLIEVRGSKGKMLFDVVGVFDPKQNKFVHMQANVKQFKTWQQAPKGGR